MKKIYRTIYKIDTRGKVREWYMEQDGSRYRTISGLQDGKKAETGWTQTEATNVGKANERDPVTQATFEIEAEYKKNLERDYHQTIEGAQGGAHFFEPMLAEKYTGFASGFGQPKLDGVRCIIKADGMWSRQGKPIFGAPHIYREFEPSFTFNPKLIVDGELYNHDLKDDFDRLISIVKKQKPTAEQLEESARVMQYHAYDLPSVQGPFAERADALSVLLSAIRFGQDACPVVLVPTVELESAEHYDQLHGQWLEEGFEGSIWRANALYEQKRSKYLRKRKEFVDAEFEVVRIEAGNGNWAGVAKRVICRLPDGREFGAGIKGNRVRAAELLHEKHKIATVKYFNLTPDGIPRFGVAIKFHGEARTL